MEGDKIWKGKRVYVKTKELNRNYSGEVVDENDFSITIIDIKGQLVLINKNDMALLQEERKRW